MQRRKNMEVKCYLNDYAGLGMCEASKRRIVIKSVPFDSNHIIIETDKDIVEIVGRDLKKAIDNCLNV